MKFDKPETGTQTAGIAIDDYKLPTFERVLTEAGYSYTQHPGLSKGTLLLKVKTSNILALKKVIERANREACR